jgi:hypothetical protein
MKHLKKAHSCNIKQIRFIRYIGRLDIYDNSREYEIEDDCYIYEVILENEGTHYVSFRQINDIIVDEEGLQGEGNCLCNIASSWSISLSLGAKKKESTYFDPLCIGVGDRVSVENHGKHWIHLGHIISIDKNTKSAVVKWEGTEQGHCSLRWLRKVVQLGCHSKETEINRFFVWDTTDKEGEATSWPNEKHVFFWCKPV